ERSGPPRAVSPYRHASARGESRDAGDYGPAAFVRLAPPARATAHRRCHARQFIGRGVPPRARPAGPGLRSRRAAVAAISHLTLVPPRPGTPRPAPSGEE